MVMEVEIDVEMADQLLKIESDIDVRPFLVLLISRL